MKPIRVLHILTKLSFGGVQSVVLNYYRNIDRNRIQFDFVVQGYEKQKFENEVIELGGNIFKLPEMHIERTKFEGELSKLLKEYKEYEIIHAHQNFLNIIPLQVAKRCGVKVRISHSHNNYKASSFSKELMRKAFRLLIPFYATDYFACSTMSANWLYGYKNARSDKCRLIHNAIDLDKFSYKADVRNRIRTELNVENKFVILHVGMFDNRKNHIFLIKIFYEFQKNNPDAILLLIGDGELMAEIIELVKSLQINDKVIFLGRKDNVNEFLMASDYFILPSKNEGLGIVLVEAQACGLQCLVSEAVPQEVNITGLVKWYKLENSSQEWARQIDKLAKRSNTRDQLIEGQYDIKTEAKKLADIYENLVSCHE